MLHSLERITAVACGIAPKQLLVGAQPVAPSRQFVEGGLLVALVEVEDTEQAPGSDTGSNTSGTGSNTGGSTQGGGSTGGDDYHDPDGGTNSDE